MLGVLACCLLVVVRVLDLGCKVLVYSVPEKKQYVLPNNDSTWFTVLKHTELHNKTNICYMQAINNFFTAVQQV